MKLDKYTKSSYRGILITGVKQIGEMEVKLYSNDLVLARLAVPEEVIKNGGDAILEYLNKEISTITLR